jgi:hypothetical protein
MASIWEDMKDMGVLVGKGGLHGNVSTCTCYVSYEASIHIGYCVVLIMQVFYVSNLVICYNVVFNSL